MPLLINPDEIITAIANMRLAGDTEDDTARMIIQTLEDEARRLLKHNGFAPTFIYSRSTTNNKTPLAKKQDRQLWERMQWLNEAIQLEDCGIYVVEQAATVLREAEAIRFCIDRGETTGAIISAFNLLACALLPADTKQALEIIRLPAKLQKQRGKTGGHGKLGYKSPIKQYIDKACKELGLNESPVKQAAARIVELFENGEELEVYHHGETCPIIVDGDGYNRDTMTLCYSERNKPGQVKTIDFDGLQRAIREIRKTKKTE